MSSPLSKLGKGGNTAAPAPVATQSPIASPLQGTLMPKADSPLARMAATNPAAAFDIKSQYKLPITSDDLEALGADTARSVGVTTDKITAKFSTASFGELGDILYKVQTQANAMDTSDLTKTGIIGWIKRKGSDVKAVLMKRMQTAQAAFDELEGKMVDQRTMLETWEKDLEALEKENYQQYLALMEDLKKAQASEALIKQTIDSWPPIDPADENAFMRGQCLQEAQDVLNDAGIKIDTLRRSILMCEHNSPDLKARIRASEAQRRTLTRMINEVLPLVKREFAKFLQTLEMQKSIQLVDSARDMGDQALRLSADSSRDAALAAARSTNTPIVSTSTIEHLRTRMLETVKGVQDIQTEAAKQREADAIKLKEGRDAYLNQLQQHKAI